MAPRARVVALLGVAVAAALLRLGYVLEVHDDPSYRFPQVDAADFHTRALQVMRGEGLGPQVHYKAPAYAWLVGQAYRLFGPHPQVIYVLQMLGGILVAVVAALLGMRWFGNVVGVIAGLASGLYPRLVYYETQLLIEPAALTVSALAVALLMFSSRSPMILAAGALTGLALQLRPLNAVLVVALLAWLLWRGGPWSLRCRQAVLFVAPVILLLIPTLRHNRLASGHLVPISVNGGINFFIGNNLDYDASVAIRPGLRWEELTRQFGAMDDPVQWEKNFYAAAFQSMRASPLQHAALTLKKFLLVWNRREIDRNQDVSVLRERSRILRGLGVPWGVLAIGGIVGSVALWGRSVPPLLLLIWLQVLGIVAFFVTSRYRLALVPWCAIATGFAVTEIAAAVWRRQSRRLILLASTLVAAGCIVLPDWTGLERSSFGRPEFDRAMVLARAGDRVAALRAYERALEQDPNDPDVVYRYGEHLELMGRRRDAIAAYTRAAGLAPAAYKPSLSLGVALYLENDLDAAWEALTEAERRGDPTGRTLFDMGLVRERQGRYEDAVDLFSRSLAKHDDRAETASRRLALGRCLVMLQKPEAAEVHFVAAEALLGDPGAVALERAEAWLRRGEPTRALALLQTVPNLDTSARGQFIRARSLETLGRFDAARAAAERSLALEPGSEAVRRFLDALQPP
ncbi:MAG TPA: tetratricopeptide repeat protein [Candidatus Krumholzibacteria bacterium]|nr:tetratricopeptide repeat protein [Candidatus Krumholzibacteria bacterium]